MTIDRLRAVLNSIGPPGDDQPVTPQELAEILWLAAHTSADSAMDAEPAVEPGDPAAEDAGQAEDLLEATEQTESLSDGQAASDADGAPGGAGQHELHVPAATDDAGTAGTAVLVPTAPMLDHPLAIQRALRPLKRRVPSRWAELLDEDATAERIADQPRGTRPWVPVMTPAPERWLSLVLVVDTGPSMRLWDPLAQELHETLTRLGAFRDLRVRYLTDTGGQGIGIRSSPAAPPTDVATLIDPSGRQVTLVLSDCSGPHWWDGRAGQALHLWAQAGPTAILQPLTERLWRRTAAPPVPGIVFPARPCAPNTTLQFAPYDGDPLKPGTIPIPVLECAPDWLADWASLVTGSGGPRPAAMAFTTNQPRHTATSTATRTRAETGPDRDISNGTGSGTDSEVVRRERALPIEERVRRFQMAASPEAVQLAAHLAVSYPALPIMRLIQHQILPDSRPGHLAEVLLSGLLLPRDIDRGQYDFVPGAREALLATLPRSESWHTADVLTRISAEIEHRAGTLAETFRAYLPTQHGTGDHAIGPDDHPFALVSPEAIRLLDRTAVPALADTPQQPTPPADGDLPSEQPPPPRSLSDSPHADDPDQDPPPPKPWSATALPPTALPPTALNPPQTPTAQTSTADTATPTDSAAAPPIEQADQENNGREEDRAQWEGGLRLPEPDGSGAILLVFGAPLETSQIDAAADLRALRELFISPELVGLRADRCSIRYNPDAQRLHAQIQSLVQAATDTLIVYVTGRLLSLPGLGTVLAPPGQVSQDRVVQLADLRRQVRNSTVRNRVLLIDGVHDPSMGSRPSVSTSMSFGPGDPEANTYELIGVREPNDPSLAHSLTQAIREGLPTGGPGLTVAEIGDVLEATGAHWNTVSVERGGPFHLARNIACGTSPDTTAAHLPHVDTSWAEEPELAESEHPARPDTAGLPALLGVPDPAELNVPLLWETRGERAFLQVPIGVDDGGRPVMLDLKESAQLGMGPHGLCVGATGSGKSELLRTLVLALATTHSPDRVSMVLVDYKGGATFAPFAKLPHIAGLITNLEGDAGLIERLYNGLAGEIQRRQQMLRDAGEMAHITEYAYHQSRGSRLEPLPHLLVIIDEFTELLSARPDFIDLLLSIGRIGRSVGVHLLLAGQRIEAGRLRGLDTYLSYRIGLRMFAEEESRVVLDTPDAFHLPRQPGFGFLKVDTSVYQSFRGVYVSGAHHGAGDPSLAELMVDQLARHGRPARRVWLPPLPISTTLGAIIGPVQLGSTRKGARQRPPVPAEPLQVPIGLLDDARRQWQGRWNLDLTEPNGHIAVIGGPRTGKTTLLRTLVLSLALTHTPAQVGVYAIDLMGGGLRALADLPNVGGVAGRGDPERVRRTVEEVHAMLEHRKEIFRTGGIESIRQLRAMHAAGQLPDLPCADVLLCVDGFGLLRFEADDLDDMMSDLLRTGGAFGIHVVASMLLWNEVRISMQACFGQVVELRLNDPYESSIDRRLVETLRTAPPGRALTNAKLFGQVALPLINTASADAEPPKAAAADDELSSAVAQTALAVREVWTGSTVPPVRVLPRHLPADALPGPDDVLGAVPIGVDERALAPVLLDLFGRDQHLVVLGDTECGKSNLVRLVAHGLVARYPSDEVVFAIMDPRRSLRGSVPEEYIAGYASSSKMCASLATAVAEQLQTRLEEEGDREDSNQEDSDHADDTKRRSQPRVVVLVDDYDLLTAARQQSLAAFLPLMPSSRDIGLHFVLTRRVAGASRGLYDPFIQALREADTPALIMSGDRTEGRLFHEVFARALPPGRGQWTRPGKRPSLIQTALLDPPAPEGQQGP